MLVLDMGEPVRISEVARQLVARATRPVEIVYTGLRRGEKLHEDLLGIGEVDVRPHHPLISQVPVPALAPEWESSLQFDGRPEDVVSWLQYWYQFGANERTDEFRSTASTPSTTSATVADTLLR